MQKTRSLISNLSLLFPWLAGSERGVEGGAVHHSMAAPPAA